MPDNIEKILRELHILLSNSESYNGSETDVIVNKRAVFDQLEKLNYAVMEVMDMYEANELSKEQAINRVKKDAQKIIDDADKSAEEIYAASLIYTDDALNELRDVVNKLRAGVVNEYDKVISTIDSQVENIVKNRDELHMKLADLSSGNEYLNIIVDEKKRREKERDRYNKVSDGEIKDQTVSRLTKHAQAAHERNHPYDEPDDFDSRISNTEVVVNVNTNHPAFNKDKSKEEDLDNLIKDTEEPAKKKTSEKDLDDMLPLPRDGEYSAADFDLDGEYFNWQEGKESTPVKEDVNIKETFLGKFFKFREEDDEN